MLNMAFNCTRLSLRRRGKWRKIASILVGLSFRELEVSNWCMDLIQEESRSGAYVGESVQLRYSGRSSA